MVADRPVCEIEMEESERAESEIEMEKEGGRRAGCEMKIERKKKMDGGRVSEIAPLRALLSSVISALLSEGLQGKRCDSSAFAPLMPPSSSPRPSSSAGESSLARTDLS
ncbi:hypothetical protein MHYP_G00313860 [Metynnis hypsauchen]